MFIVVGLVLAVVPALASPAVPVAKLTCGILEGQDIDMPILAVGTGGYKGVNATAAIGRALAAGFTHVHTAFDYFNLPYVGAALSAYPRESLFISSMTSPCIHKAPPARNMTDPDGCYNLTLAEISSLLTSLKLDALDLLMLHGPSEPFGHDGPCSSLACTLNRAQWRAYQTLRAAGKVKAIGVSNFCQSCLACLNSTSPADTPAVNQIQVHVRRFLITLCPAQALLSCFPSPLASRAESPPSLHAYACVCGLCVHVRAGWPGLGRPGRGSAVILRQAWYCRASLRATRGGGACDGCGLRGHRRAAQSLGRASRAALGAAAGTFARRALGHIGSPHAGLGRAGLQPRCRRARRARRQDGTQGRGGRPMQLGVHPVNSDRLSSMSMTRVPAVRSFLRKFGNTKHGVGLTC